MLLQLPKANSIIGGLGDETSKNSRFPKKEKTARVRPVPHMDRDAEKIRPPFFRFG